MVHADTKSNCFPIIFLMTEQVIAPSFIKPLTDMQEILGSFVQICCKISGSLPISVEWLKDGTKISSGVKHKLVQQDNSVFVEIEQLERSDAGSYSCKLTNAAGSCECSGSLMVKGQGVLSSVVIHVILNQR